MRNDHLLNRMAGIQRQLLAGHATGLTLSSSSKGREREEFISGFLSRVFPNSFRFGTGDVTDTNGRRSGQLDVVIEYPFGPSLPAIGGGDVRLYLAESVAAVIEVKSDLQNQWQEVESTAAQLSPLVREFGGMISVGRPPPESRIPIVAVGYEGWKTLETLKAKVESSNIDAALIIDGGLFISKDGIEATGACGMWAMICFINATIQGLVSASTNPFRYIAE
ncbi:hypothetical protein HJB96_09045 [Rhizobium sp. NLR15a]|uniref:DUF6602 domain-containing protein n=1 Tax=Rhizobium sp. NLR15a TaxID=2731111 RepID=UPI001C82A129|nr:DUF6602 domain-containing protein [Rhizobium sp. NLR15a]MBX5293088.1 hypothetical protein [Rhizobium sp. NLR15a]